MKKLREFIESLWVVRAQKVVKINFRSYALVMRSHQAPVRCGFGGNGCLNGRSHRLLTSVKLQRGNWPTITMMGMVCVY